MNVEVRVLQMSYFTPANANPNILVGRNVIEFVLLRYSVSETCVSEVPSG